jgi:hypothetical protein
LWASTWWREMLLASPPFTASTHSRWYLQYINAFHINKVVKNVTTKRIKSTSFLYIYKIILITFFLTSPFPPTRCRARQICSPIFFLTFLPSKWIVFPFSWLFFLYLFLQLYIFLFSVLFDQTPLPRPVAVTCVHTICK